MAARGVLETLQQVEDSSEAERVIKAIVLMSDDSDSNGIQSNCSFCSVVYVVFACN